MAREQLLRYHGERLNEQRDSSMPRLVAEVRLLVALNAVNQVVPARYSELLWQPDAI